MKNLYLQGVEKTDNKHILIRGIKYLDFTSGNFLGLKSHEKLKDAAKKAIDLYGIDSEVVPVNSKAIDIYLEVKTEITKLKKQEDTILYNSGYNINAGVIPTIFDEKDIIFSDSENFIELYQGIYKSGAHLIRYKHNNIEDLKNKIKKNRDKFKKAGVITDTIFNTDGQKAKLKEIVKLKEEFDFIFIVDESNADGIYGGDLGGVVLEQKVEDEVDIIVGSFSKNLGVLGEYVSGKVDYINLLMKNSLNKNIFYKSVMTPIFINSLKTALDIIKDEEERREKVLKYSEKIREELMRMEFNIAHSASHIIPIVFNTNEEAILLSKFLYKNGILVSTSIAKNTIKPRIKIYISTLLEDEDIEILLKNLKEFKEKNEIKKEVIETPKENLESLVKTPENEEVIDEDLLENLTIED
ncbi:glycine C-acetyltransferase/8-amino-7-oxononanoate synthase [Hypnocyclicus thermotrophus]|uniref:Glycine C-acetyltransferase/8-amino-7-oxononanoate synthase n=1 Tax=Hypnocyclicus thermotrophus TaxID=1627895 RepID=A0AA46I663_9FUSO|nr:aminotransferase class I/II-fold pyridoxal phosphate-dependent enzyme [Hypnocyclicus thermotrophus]TDT72219.1 glycine C-acetyltransferase/8-amino-7-oxononanoate synthase [Hypnocyclicus thermotrophus]